MHVVVYVHICMDIDIDKQDSYTLVQLRAESGIDQITDFYYKVLYNIIIPVFKK